MSSGDRETRALYRPPSAGRAQPERIRIALLGATGSIGRQTVDLIRRFPARFTLGAVAIHSRLVELAELLDWLEAETGQKPAMVAVFSEAAHRSARSDPRWRGRLLEPGTQGLQQVVSLPDLDCVVNGLVGAIGLVPTLAAAERGLRLALANKESLVVGGELVHQAVRRGGAEILPVDSEHSAIAQCLSGRSLDELESIILTASGGPFREWPLQKLRQVTPADTLQHPTWRMGPKITVDSATLMNKGLEVIEAHYLFGMPYEAIEVLVHPGSVVHSLIQLRDGAVLAQLGTPDMRIPLLYAMAGENHWPLASERLDLIKTGGLQFENPDEDRFPCLKLARQAGQAGGRAPIVLNAANEVAVQSHLAGKLHFVDISRVIHQTLEASPNGSVGGLEEALAVDRESRRLACSFLD